MLAQVGVEDAIAKDPALFKGLNVYGGHVTYEPVARSLNMDYRPYRMSAAR